MTDSLDIKLDSLVNELPPATNTAQGVNPWKNAIYKTLAGICLTLIELKIPVIEHVLPVLGAIFLVLGTRSLRSENKEFHACYVISVIKLIVLACVMVFRSTALNIMDAAEKLLIPLSVFGLASTLLFLVFFRAGIIDVKRKAGLGGGAGSVLALMIWLVILSAIAVFNVGYGALVWLMLAVYVLIIVSVVRLAKSIAIAGYAITPAEVRVSDNSAAVIIIAVIAIGVAVGNLFFSKLPMQWEKADLTPSASSEIMDNLRALGFPEMVLNDLSYEDLEECRGADMVRVGSTYDSSKNGNRAYSNDLVIGAEGECVTAVISVRIPDGGSYKWFIVDYFCWNGEARFYGNELMWLVPIYNRGLFTCTRPPKTGRVFCEINDETLTSDYYFAGEKTVQTTGILTSGQSEALNTVIWSFPTRATNARGYITYTAVSDAAHQINENSLINYYHQKSPVNYPVRTVLNTGDMYLFGNSPFVLFNDIFMHNTEGLIR